MHGDAEITVVLARRDHRRLRERILHDRTSRRIARSLGRYEHVDLATVPYRFEAADRPADDAGSDADAIS